MSIVNKKGEAENDDHHKYMKNPFAPVSASAKSTIEN